MTEEQIADTLDLLLCGTSGEGQYTVAAVSAVAFIQFSFAEGGNAIAAVSAVALVQFSLAESGDAIAAVSVVALVQFPFAEGGNAIAAVSAVAFINFYLCAQCRYDKQKQQYHQKFFHFFCLSRITDAVRQKKTPIR